MTFFFISSKAFQILFENGFKIMVLKKQQTHELFKGFYSYNTFMWIEIIITVFNIKKNLCLYQIIYLKSFFLRILPTLKKFDPYHFFNKIIKKKTHKLELISFEWINLFFLSVCTFAEWCDTFLLILQTHKCQKPATLGFSILEYLIRQEIKN